MTRSRITPGSRPSASWFAAALVALGCRNDLPYEGAFIVPTAAAVLHPEVGGPTADHEPVGFVANGIGGRIVLLALKQGRFLNDDPTASFLRTNDLPTGGLRLLQSIAVYAPEPFDVVAFAGDAAFDQLVEVPWIVGSEVVDGREVPVESYASFYPPESSNPEVVLAAIEVKQGYTTSEVWTLTSDGVAWDVVGSRSGRQPTRAEPGMPFAADERRVGFTINSAGAPGDTVTLETWSGLVEHDVGGTPYALAMSPDQRIMAMVVHDRAVDRPVVRWFDPAAKRVVGDLALPSDAAPHRLEWSEDGQTLFVSDLGRAAVWAARSVAVPSAQCGITPSAPRSTAHWARSRQGRASDIRT